MRQSTQHILLGIFKFKIKELKFNIVTNGK